MIVLTFLFYLLADVLIFASLIIAIFGSLIVINAEVMEMTGRNYMKEFVRKIYERKKD